MSKWLIIAEKSSVAVDIARARSLVRASGLALSRPGSSSRRVGIYRGQGWMQFRLKVSPAVRRIRSSPRVAGVLDRGPEQP